MLRIIERKIEGLIEKTFGRAFRSELQPVELARKLAREMEQHKTVSVSRVYVPNEFAIYLSGSDREHFASYENSLRAELANYLDAHARGEGLSMVGEAVVIFETDSDLRTGEFGIACRMADQPGTAAPPVVAPEIAGAAASAPIAPAATPSASDPFSAHVTGAGMDAIPADLPVKAEVADPPAEVNLPAPPEDEGAERAVAEVAEDAPVLPDEPASPDRLEEEVDGLPDQPDAYADEPEADDRDAEPEPLLPADEPAAPEPDAVLPADEPPIGEPPVEPDDAIIPMEEPPVVMPAAEPVAAAPIDPPPVHDALEGVSGTQIFTADQAREAGVPTEEMVLRLPGEASHKITRRVTTLGRGRGNDLVIPDANISRNHAEIRHIGLDYFLVDLDSTNGVEVNGEQVRRHALAHGDVVVVGTTEITVELG